MSDDPHAKRLLDTLSHPLGPIDPIGRAVLDSASDDNPTDQSRRAAAAAIGISGVPMSDGGATTTAASGGLLKASLALLVTGIVAGGALLFDTPDERPVEAPVTAVEAEEVYVEIPDPIVEPPVVEVVVVPEAKAEEAAVRPSTSKKRPTLAPSRLSEEVRLLDRARTAAAAGDFDVALRVLETYRTSFADGTLAEEAAALRVTTLADAGHKDDATKAADRFFEQYPESSHRTRIKALIR